MYAISELSISDLLSSDENTTFSDANCATPDGRVETSTASYVVGSTLTASDGTAVSRITLMPIVPNRPDLSVNFEAVYRISGVELVYGEFFAGTVPALNYQLTYTRQ